MTDLVRAPAWRQREAVVAGEVSVRELTSSVLDAIDAAEPSLHAFLYVAREQALSRADALDRALAEGAGGAEPGPLFGVPVSVKDLYLTADMPTTAGSLVIKERPRTGEESAHVSRVREAGAVIVGKTNTPEFALFPRTRNRLAPETVNPWDPSRTCGGSSGGAAASVGAGVTPLAIASDGGGSTRIPAALCGIMGMLPTQGMLPRHGGVGGTLMFSQAGPVARDVRDMAALYAVMAGPDPRDPVGRTGPVPDVLGPLESGVQGLRLRWVAGNGVIDPDPRVVAVAEAAAVRLREAGAVLTASARGFGAGPWVDHFYAMMGADRYASIGAEVFEDPAARALLSEYGESHFAKGQKITGAAYSRALETRFAARRSMRELLDGADILVSPTVGRVAPRLTEPIERLDMVAYTFFCNYTGLPATTMPCGFVDGMPVGLQFIGRPGSEPELLRACRALERLLPPAFPWVS